MRATLQERFEAKYVPVPYSGCWLWDAAVNGAGYGVIQRGGRVEGTMLAHQFSYELHIGDRRGLFVLHECDQPACVNPEHLFLGDQAANMGDAATKGRLFQRAR